MAPTIGRLALHNRSYGSILGDWVAPPPQNIHHDALDTALAGIIGIALHGEAIHTNNNFFSHAGIVFAIGTVAASHFQYALRNKIFSGTVALYDSFNRILQHILIISRQLLRVFWQAVSTITERCIIIMKTDTQIQIDAVDDLTGIQPLHLCISIQFVEVAFMIY